jgi:hypothetical protein
MVYTGRVKESTLLSAFVVCCSLRM